MRHILTPLALLTFGALTGCDTGESLVLADDGDLHGTATTQDEWCKENGYTPGSKECESAWFMHNADKNASGGTTDRESDDPDRWTKYKGSIGGISTVSTHGDINPDDIDPNSLLNEWGIGIYGSQVDPFTFVLVDELDPNLFHTIVSFDQPTEIYGVSQHEAFDIHMMPLAHSQMLLHTDRGIFEVNDALSPMLGTQFFIWTQW